MDSADLTLTGGVVPMEPFIDVDITGLHRRAAGSAVGETDGPAEDKKKQVAKDFESVFIGKLLDQAERTIGDWGFEEQDGTSSQVRGLFWLLLAREVADKGGFGLWKDVYRFLSDTGTSKTTSESVGGDV
jgi:Rod binding domain-containing protein